MKVNLSLLAQVLAQKVGVEVVAGPHLATNGKVIFVPPDLMGDETAAVIVRGGVCHEAVGHVRHTDFSVAPKEKLLRSLLNVIEDIRIEKLAWRCYPGARRILEEMAVTVDGKGWFSGPPKGQEQQRPESVLLMALLRDLRTRVLMQPLDPVQTADLIQQAQSVFGNRWPQVIALAEAGAAGADTAAAYQCAMDILALVCNPGKNQAQSQQQQNPGAKEQGDGDGNGDGQKGGDQQDRSGDSEPQGSGSQSPEDKAGSKDPGAGGAGQENASTGDQSQKGDGDGSSASQEAGDHGQTAENSNRSESGAEPSASSGAQGGQSSGQGAAVQSCEEVTSVVCDPTKAPDVSLDEMIGQFVAGGEVSQGRYCRIPEGPLMAPAAIDGKSSGLGMAARLRADLERLLLSRVQDEDDAIVDRGRFDTTRLVEAMMGSKEVFTREQEEGEGLDTEVYILVDRSGSTTMIIKSINEAVWGIGGAMAGFEGSHLDFGVWYYDDVLKPAKRPHVRWAQEKRRCQAFASGGTNWLGAFLNLTPRLAQSKRTKKVVYTITDGDLGDDASAQAAIRSAEKLGIDLVFLMVDVPAPAYAGQHRNVVASTVQSRAGAQGLQRAIFDSLRKSLI